jgi:hypothetical protein
MKILLPILLIFSFAAVALEVDEKLTVRMLRLSKSKKTALLNRGLEDGLVVGDHAKFYLTSGVIARGVVVKASPTRSVWSVYRFVAPDQLVEDRVLGIKISTPVKLTEDASKAFRGNQYANIRENLAIPLEKGADDIDSQLSEEDRTELMNLGGNPPPPVYTSNNMGVDTSKTIEVFGLAHFSSLSTSAENSSGTSAGSNSTIDFSLGVEKYFAQTNSWLSAISLYAYFHKITKEVSGIQGSATSLDALEYGLGLSYHFWASPLAYGRPIGYVTASFGVGDATDTGEIISGTELADSQLDGESTFASVGFGIKYNIQNGFGGRVLIDYYRRGESYSVTVEDTSGNESDQTFEKVVSGPRMQLGLSYRF